MKIVITGALGHIGSALIRSFRPGDASEVVLIDDLSAQRYVSLFHLPAGVPFRFVEADVCQADLVPLLQGADVVVHLAAITNAAGSFENQARVEQVNLDGTRRVAEACAAVGARLLFLSTTSVYGTQSDVVDEDCAIDDLQPQSPYADSKLKAEQLLAGMSAKGLRHVTCRFGTIFGPSPGMRFHTAVNKFVWQALLGQPLTVWRTAMHQRRPYLDLTDGVRAIRFIMERDLFDGRIYNVVTLNATVADILDVIRERVPDVQTQLVDARIMNQLSYTVSAKRFESQGFEFQGDLRRGVGATVEQLHALDSMRRMR